RKKKIAREHWAAYAHCLHSLRLVKGVYKSFFKFLFLLLYTHSVCVCVCVITQHRTRTVHGHLHNVNVCVAATGAKKRTKKGQKCHINEQRALVTLLLTSS